MSRRERRLHKSRKVKHKVHVEEKQQEQKVKVEKMNPVLKFYDKNYKGLLLIPLIMLILAIGIIFIQVANTGDFVNKAVSLKGGTTITILPENVEYININLLENSLRQEFSEFDISVRQLSKAGKLTGLIIDTDIHSTEDINEFLSFLEEKLEGDLGDYSTEHIGSSLGASFFKETLVALLIAFLCMGIVVFIYFRTFAPSIAVISAALSDIIITLAIINLMGMKLSTAGIAAFLMLIGYSVDTDILLTTRLVKRKKGTVLDRLMSAMKTGLTMSATTIAVVTLALIFSQSDTIRQIMIILLIGLLVDLINTWIQNAGILRWYLDSKKNG